VVDRRLDFFVKSFYDSHNSPYLMKSLAREGGCLQKNPPLPLEAGVGALSREAREVFLAAMILDAFCESIQVVNLRR
jgi:hypothetical protein